MPPVQQAKHHDVLLVRPWLSSIGGGDAYAHFDALVMRRVCGARCGRYSDYRVSYSDGDKGPLPRHENFRFQCQTDDRHAESYAWKWGYQPSSGSIFTARDLGHCARSITIIDRALTRMEREDGPAGSVGRFVVRLARILKLDGIVVIGTSPHGSFRDATEIRSQIEPRHYADAMRLVDSLVVELHQACAERVGKIAA